MVRSWIQYLRSASHIHPIALERIRRDIERRAGERYDRLFVRDSRKSVVRIPKAEVRRRLRGAIIRAARLGLNSPPHLDILDIGCGAGFFIAVAKYLGHRCTGTDLPDSVLSGEFADFYSACLEAFDCKADRQVLIVRPYEPLKLPRRFDLITAGLICFDDRGSEGGWSRHEWEYFVNDARQYLTEGGRLFLEFNEHAEYGRWRWYRPETLSYFAQIGQVNRNTVIVTNPG